MGFFCKHSAKTLKFLTGLENEGHHVPALADAPELYPDALPYWAAFIALSSSRQIGMGLGGIPYTEVTGYLDENRIFKLEHREQYRKWIGFIDSLYVQEKTPKPEAGKRG